MLDAMDAGDSAGGRRPGDERPCGGVFPGRAHADRSKRPRYRSRGSIWATARGWSGINLRGDLSTRRASASRLGLMVNYLYDLDHIEANHEAFANRGVVAASWRRRRG